ncbi:MAG: hypothetical protein DMF95_14135, partial [Acidobacteria bacterium]
MGARAAPALQTSTNSFEGERTPDLRGFHQSILRRNREGTDSTKLGQVKSCSLAERTQLDTIGGDERQIVGELRPEHHPMSLQVA